jgi:DNA-binding response OmpR family regulator
METTQLTPAKANILVVDDKPEALNLLANLLTREGYKVRPVPDGQMALSVARSVPPDLVLLDIMMPGLDGYEVCQQLKADERTHDIPVIFITVLNDDVNKVKAFAAGGVDYITKPFRIEEVLARVGVQLALRRRNYELALLNRVGQDLTATHDLQRIAEKIQQAVTEIVGATGTSVWLRDQEQEEWLICQAAFQHESDQFWTNLRVQVGQGVAGWVAQTGQSTLITDAADDPRFFSGIDQQTGFYTHSLLAVPLRIREQVIGVLEVVNKLSGEFTVNDLDLVETIAASAAIAIDNAWLVDTLHQHAVELERSNTELQEALAKVKTLSGLLPICSNCKKIRDDEGYWQRIEDYIRKHSDAEFSHGICVDCAQKLYPELYQKSVERRENILNTLKDLGRVSLEVISAAVGMPESNTFNRLQDMVDQGLIKCLEVDGQTLYELSDEA